MKPPHKYSHGALREIPRFYRNSNECEHELCGKHNAVRTEMGIRYLLFGETIGLEY